MSLSRRGRTREGGRRKEGGDVCEGDVCGKEEEEDMEGTSKNSR